MSYDYASPEYFHNEELIEQNTHKNRILEQQYRETYYANHGEYPPEDVIRPELNSDYSPIEEIKSWPIFWPYRCKPVRYTLLGIVIIANPLFNGLFVLACYGGYRLWKHYT